MVGNMSLEPTGQPAPHATGASVGRRVGELVGTNDWDGGTEFDGAVDGIDDVLGWVVKVGLSANRNWNCGLYGKN